MSSSFSARASISAFALVSGQSFVSLAFFVTSVNGGGGGGRSLTGISSNISTILP